MSNTQLLYIDRRLMMLLLFHDALAIEGKLYNNVLQQLRILMCDYWCVLHDTMGDDVVLLHLLGL
jgi:hypothetical protein